MNYRITNKKIQHQKQPDGITCLSASLAMVLNQDVEKIVSEFHEDYRNDRITPFNFLINKKCSEIRRCFSDESLCGSENIYMAIVPSLNIEAGQHSVVFDFRDYLIVYDPNKGNPGKKYYTFDSKEAQSEELAVMLKTYVLEIEFRCGEQY